MYMAPEQAVGASDIDHRADIYSMAVMLYEMLGGRRPFDGADAVSVLAAVMTATPPRLADLCPDLPPGVARVIEGAMSRDKKLRPAGATELLAALRKAATEAAPRPRMAGATALHGGALDELGPRPRVGPDALAAPVLTDLAPAADADCGRLDILYPPLAAPSWADTSVPAAAPEPELARAAAPAPAPAPRPPTRRRALLIAVPIAVVAVAAAVVVPRLGGSRAVVEAPAGPPMALVRFDVTPPGGRVIVDGVPITSNPMRLRADIPHTIQADADGYEMDYYKGTVREGVPITFKLRRKR
jgi:serine/threonine-protein kinase